MRRIKKSRKKSATARAKEQDLKVAFLSNVNDQITLERGLRAMRDISKIENGTFSVAPTTIKIADLIQDQVSEIQQHAERKGIKLLCEIEDPGIKVRIDSYCLSHALANLLDNALKYTENGRILVRVSVHPRRIVQIDVEDTGLGIDSRDLPMLFQPFSRKPAQPEEFGMGLGLALANRYLALNGARLSVKSKKSRGSVFTIHLRIASRPALKCRPE
jgi:signal transduction histidine kinase